MQRNLRFSLLASLLVSAQAYKGLRATKSLSAEPPRNCSGSFQLAQAAAQHASEVERALEAAIGEGNSANTSTQLMIAQQAIGQLLHSIQVMGEKATDVQSLAQDLQRGTGKDKLQLMLSKIKALSASAEAKASLSLNDLLQSTADRMQQGTPQYDFLRSLRLCAACNNFQRTGEVNDGGYIICADSLDGTLQGAYSYGIDGFDGWGMDMAQRYHVPVYEYDCFNLNAPVPCSGCEVKFNPECIRGNNEIATGTNAKTLSEQIAQNGQANAPASSLLMKLDVEGAEYAIWSQETATTLSKFRHINTEFHWIDREAPNSRSAQAMRKLLDNGFAVAHLHGNNWQGMYQVDGYSVPKVIEVTLVRQPLGTACAGMAPRHIPQDMPCNAGAAELPNPVLPSA